MSTKWTENDRGWRQWQRQIGTFNLCVTMTSGGKYVPILEALSRSMAYRFYEGPEFDTLIVAKIAAERLARKALEAALSDLGDDGKEDGK